MASTDTKVSYLPNEYILDDHRYFWRLGLDDIGRRLFDQLSAQLDSQLDKQREAAVTYKFDKNSRNVLLRIQMFYLDRYTVTLSKSGEAITIKLT